MDIIQVVSGYITKMVSVGDSAATGTSAAKMKILLLDNETVGLSPLPGALVQDSNRLQGPHSFHSDDAIRPAQP